MLQPQGKLPTQWHTRCTAALTMAPVPQPPCSTNTEQWGSSESSPRSLKVQAACSTAVATPFSTTPMHQRVQLQWSAEKKATSFTCSDAHCCSSSAPISARWTHWCKWIVENKAGCEMNHSQNKNGASLAQPV